MGLPGKPVQAQPQAPLQGQSQADVPCQTLCRDDGAGSLGWGCEGEPPALLTCSLAQRCQQGRWP